MDDTLDQNVDPSSAEGALQRLQAMAAQRDKLVDTRNQAQQKYFGALNTPVPTTGVISGMVSDYLSRYAERPNAFAAIAGAAGSQAGRNQAQALAERNASILAAQKEAELAGANIDDEDRYLGKSMDLLGRQQAAAAKVAGKTPTPEKLADYHKSASLRWAREADKLEFKNPDGTTNIDAKVAWIRSHADEDTQNFIKKWSIQPTGPRGEPITVETTAPVAQAKPAANVDPLNLKLFFPKDSDVDQNKIVKQMQVNQSILRDPNASVQAKESASKILMGLNDKYGSVGEYQPSAAQPEVGQVVQPESVIQKPLISPRPRDVGAEKSREKELVTVSEGYGKQYNEVLKGAGNAQNTLYAIDNIESNLQGYNTGKLTPMTTEIAAWLKPLGIEIDKKLSNKEAFQKAVGQLTLGLKNVGGENNMPGSLSDSDRKFLESMAPTLADTPEGNRLAIGYYRKIAQRQIDMARQAEDYFERNGTYKGFRKEWDGYVKNNPLFGNQESTQPKRIRITADMLKGK